MKIIVQIVYFLFFTTAFAQKNSVQTIYFEYDKFTLSHDDKEKVLLKLDSLLVSEFYNIQIFGYCDERGSNEYNIKLSKKRVDFVNNLLIEKGISSSKISIMEGRGEIEFDKNSTLNRDKEWANNRRVDVLFLKKNRYHSIPTNPELGDVIILEHLNFELGSSKLCAKVINELDRFVLELNKHKTLQFEIRGHVCCTSKASFEAIDKDTQNKNLSVSRAKNVFLYLRSKGISPYRMSFKGYGNQFPLGKEEDKDRRVEFYIKKI